MSDTNSSGAGSAMDPTLDERILGQLEHLGDASGEDLVGELATMFVADADERVKAMRKALADADADAMASSAHNISGASASLGATHLSSLCSTLEHESATGDLSNGASLLEAVESELQLVNSAFASRKAARCADHGRYAKARTA
jgi:HPt (histidine-containing phosphotransfer) domain-containing protein